jgi:hypothetical protein
MDLSERTEHGARRHPWETARVRAIQQIIAGLGLESPSVLDVGAGDGYLLRALHAGLRFRRAVAQDIHFTDSLIQELSQPGLEFVRELPDASYRPELILLLDVLEHLEDPFVLLAQLGRERLADGGRIVITVPAFQPLYTEHDRALKHFRRYSRSQAAELARAAGLRVIDSGYLFSSLLLPRAASALKERLLAPRSEQQHGVGGWRASEIVTRVIHGALVLDNQVCLAASERGIHLPGLTAWLTCKKPS